MDFDHAPGMHSHAAQMGWYADGEQLFFVDYTVINGSEADLSNVNAGGTDVGAMSYRNGVTLTNAELATLCATTGVAVTKDGTGVASASQLKRAIAIASQFLNPLA